MRHREKRLIADKWKEEHGEGSDSKISKEFGKESRFYIKYGAS